MKFHVYSCAGTYHVLSDAERDALTPGERGRLVPARLDFGKEDEAQEYAGLLGPVADWPPD